MEKLINDYLLPNWQRKCVALIIAIVIWLFVNHTITGVKTIPNVPIRIINLPADKTISGALANGILGKRINLTLNGTKNVIEQIESGDLEVLLDASAQPDEWAIQLTKKHLISLNPQIDMARHISQVSHGELIVHMSRLATAKIPVTVTAPVGLPPRGYEYIDTWPSQLYHTVSAAEEQIKELHNTGLDLTFNLNDISKSDLDSLHSSMQLDEVSFPVPEKWKMVSLPYQNKITEAINDPEADKIRIHFLRKQLLSLNSDIPIRLFYPLKTIATINPNTFSIGTNEIVTKKNGVTVLSIPLYALDVSRLFIDVIRNHIEITITAAQPNENGKVEWNIALVDPQALENTYVTRIFNEEGYGTSTDPTIRKQQEEYLRNRFRDYAHKFALFLAKNHRLELKGHLHQGTTLHLTMDEE
jgi:hypothetical protein